MNNVEVHKGKMAETRELLKTATGRRRNDLLKYMRRLNRELTEFRYWTNGKTKKSN